MATNRNAMAMCDTCSFVYPHRVMQLNSYSMLVCQECFDGAYDLKNHPQNKPASLREDPAIQNARIDDTGRNLTWEQSGFTWDDITQDRWWQTI